MAGSFGVPVIALDGQILWWVLLPITVVMFLLGILRHYASLLIADKASATRKVTKNSRVLICLLCSQLTET